MASSKNEVQQLDSKAIASLPMVRGQLIRTDENGLVCLNDIHKASGFTVNRRPGDWRDNPSTGPLQIAVMERITGKSGNWSKDDWRRAIRTRTGANGGTYADVRLALSYAEYLNPKLALEVKEVFLRFKAADPTLADDVLERASADANEWAGRRALSRAIRKGYTDTLKGHGVVRGPDFGMCTNALYQGLFDKTAKQLKEARGAKGSLRDKMDLRELAYVMASEALSSERIEEQACEGPAPCREATRTSARFIRDAIEGDRRDRKAAQPRLL